MVKDKKMLSKINLAQLFGLDKTSPIFASAGSISLAHATADRFSGFVGMAAVTRMTRGVTVKHQDCGTPQDNLTHCSLWATEVEVLSVENPKLSKASSLC